MVSGGFLRTTVGRRLFARFLLAAFLPALVTAAIATSFVRSEVRSGIEWRVGRSAKLAGLNTLATLKRLDSVFRHAALAGQQGASPRHQPVAVPPGFAAIEFRTMADGVPGVGAQAARPLTEKEQGHLTSGKTLIAVRSRPAQSTLFMAALDQSEPAADRVLWGRIAEDAIWGTVNDALQEDGTRFCAMELPRDRPLVCDQPLPPDAQVALGAIRGAGRIGLATWEEDRTRMHAASWDVFLRYVYGAPDWRVIVSQTSDATFGSTRRFTMTFTAILLLALLIVLVLSHSQIRRSTEPLEQLQAGTRRLEAGDFQTQVQVESRDEYAGLAQSFNRMARTLDRQIVTLRGLDELHRSILGARDVRPLLEAALVRIGALVPSADLLVAIEQQDGSLETLLRASGALQAATADITLTDSERLELTRSRGALSLPPGERRQYLAVEPFVVGVHATNVIPFVREGQLLGFVAVGAPAGAPLSDEQLEGVRRLSDRLALAIADVQHLRHLAALSSGTLTAFARAIDANSPWTAGHSERVTGVALVIGERLGLATSDLSILQRGGLLHDIGKIGVPPQILDKAGPLTEAERRVIERHPGLGAEILAPIGAFTDAIPIVRSHHERVDGRGYPDGLAGDDIPFLARVLGVADVFDALVSDRPYRAGLEVSNAMWIIQQGAGTHFDPAPVAAFMEAMRLGTVLPVMAAQSTALRLATSVVAARRTMEDAA